MVKKRDVLVEEVEAEIKRFKSNRSPGTDNISGEMMKYGVEKLKKEIHSLCNAV